MPKPKASPDAVYQIKVTLRDVRPPVWRRLQMAGDISLSKLHRIIQAAFGWKDYHLHQFTADGQFYGPSGLEMMEDLDMRPESRAKLNRVAPQEASRILYEYDFGDSWMHEILVEKILPPEPGATYPRCLKGMRACPPEDCGGPWGYADLLETLADPDNPEYEDMMEWVGGKFDPNAFNLETVNIRLKTLR